MIAFEWRASRNSLLQRGDRSRDALPVRLGGGREQHVSARCVRSPGGTRTGYALALPLALSALFGGSMSASAQTTVAQLLPTGQAITPTAAPGAVFQQLSTNSKGNRDISPMARRRSPLVLAARPCWCLQAGTTSLTGLTASDQPTYRSNPSSFTTLRFQAPPSPDAHDPQCVRRHCMGERWSEFLCRRRR